MKQKIDFSVNYYDVLGITQKATHEEIKTKYRKLVQHNHPDKNDHTKAADVFLLIQEAYSILSDPSLRKQYDSKFYPKNNYKDFKLDITLKESITGVKINTHLGVIDIPKGIRDKAKLVYVDSIIEISVSQDTNFVREMDHLYTNFKIDSLVAITGGKVKYEHITGDTLHISVPKGTQYGDILKLDGYGALNTETKQIGNLYLKCILVTPVLTEQQITDIISIASISSQYNERK